MVVCCNLVNIMSQFINRTWERTEHDDYALNIRPILDRTKQVSTEVRLPKDHKEYPNLMVGWKIHRLHED